MRDLSMPFDQILANNIRAKKDFTLNLGIENSRYIVGAVNLFTGNPAKLQDNLFKRIESWKEDFADFDTIGGWMDAETGLYYVDLGFRYSNLDIALDRARVFKQISIYDELEKKLIFV